MKTEGRDAVIGLGLLAILMVVGAWYTQMHRYQGPLAVLERIEMHVMFGFLVLLVAVVTGLLALAGAPIMRTPQQRFDTGPAEEIHGLEQRLAELERNSDRQ